MTEQEAVDAIKGGVTLQLAGVKADPANAEAIAKGLLRSAILKVGRTPGVDWNREAVTFTLTSGQSVYKCGQDILGEFSRIRNLQFLWRTDTQDNPIRIVNLQEFNAYARGSSGTGKPELATMHSSDETLEIWRTPDAAYSVWGYVQKKIVNFTEIPEYYHDVVVHIAIASLNPQNALAFAKSGLDEVRGDSLTTWDGNSIPMGRHIGADYSNRGADSGNLRGD